MGYAAESCFLARIGSWQFFVAAPQPDREAGERPGGDRWEHYVSVRHGDPIPLFLASILFFRKENVKIPAARDSRRRARQ